ncbi:hypothetical protein AVEN_107491-1 [Araneus ventricosus]|uniref:Uncharacterized protein n=1 Tax=Araneus ventricosus TaxID=182803 RepID=A0A4Y2S447_ARAVE|nr:hypothetical protein AVEN_107491-1 [Araneus ventricosus]
MTDLASEKPHVWPAVVWIRLLREMAAARKRRRTARVAGRGLDTASERNDPARKRRITARMAGRGLDTAAERKDPARKRRRTARVAVDLYRKKSCFESLLLV